MPHVAPRAPSHDADALMGLTWVITQEALAIGMPTRTVAGCTQDRRGKNVPCWMSPLHKGELVEWF